MQSGSICTSTVSPARALQDSREHSASLMVVTIFISRCNPQVLSPKEAEGETIASVGSAANRAAWPLRCRP